ncbi:MAG: hypothetical protein ACRDRK_06300 [Pseudonocardia sp.]
MEISAEDRCIHLALDTDEVEQLHTVLGAALDLACQHNLSVRAGSLTSSR